MRIAEVEARLKTSFVGKPIVYYPQVSSTNEVAKQLAREGAAEGTVVLAETQTSGHGRLRRKWFSPKGGLWFSLILHPKLEPTRLPQLTFMTAAATAKTIKDMYGLKAGIKWPNDVLVNRRKVCGILTEGCMINGKVKFAVVGVGVNANINLEELPLTVRKRATSLKKELGKPVSREELLCRLLLRMENAYLTLQREGFSPILEEVKSLSVFLGERVKIASFGECFVGLAENLDGDGALVVRLENGTRRKVVVGDLEVLSLEP